MISIRAREIFKQLRALADIPEDLDSIPSHHGGSQS